MARAPASEAPAAPEPDRVPGAPHPRMAPGVIGQDAALADFAAANRAGRLHHAWLISGPRGIGKATLAWTLAKWLLAGAPEDGLILPPDDPTVRRIRALSDPRLHLVRRPVDPKTGRLGAQITVEEIRKLLAFFHLSAAEGGHRVAIIDAADEMNPSAANALLKALEEPPKGAVLFLIAHQPARLLPTIRSRCRALRLVPLADDLMPAALSEITQRAALDEGNAPALTPEEASQLAALSDGAMGEALRLAGQDGLARYHALIALMATTPRMDRIAAADWANAAAGRVTAEGDPFDLAMMLLDRFLIRLTRSGLGAPPAREAAPGEAALMARLCADAQAARIWAGAQAELSARARQGRAVNLDPAALVMDMLISLATLPPAQNITKV